jgi:hypothetical protein
MLRGFVSPELMFFQVSGNAVINVIVGGTGTLVGALYGSALLTVLKSVVGSFTAHHAIVIGALFVVSVIFFPKGLVGYLAPALQRWRSGAGPAHEHPSTILKVRGLTVRFGTLVAVSDVSFDAQRGHITSVIGPNGAGKSSLFNLISGAILPSAGQVLFEGRDMTGQRPDKMLAAGLARSFQITNLFFELPVRENLRLAAQFVENGRGLFRGSRGQRVALARVDELIERFAAGAGRRAGGFPVARRAAPARDCRGAGRAPAPAAAGRADAGHEPCRHPGHRGADPQPGSRGLEPAAGGARRRTGDEPVGPCGGDAPGRQARRGPAAAGARRPGGAGRLFRRCARGQPCLN